MCSCDYKIYVNGQFSHKVDKTSSYKNSGNDQCIVLSLDDKIPDSAILINETKIKYGYSPDSFQIFSINYSLLEMAKNEAKLCAANILKIRGFTDGNTFQTDNIVVDMYKLNEPYLLQYKNRVDTLDTTKKSLCRVHIRNWMYNPNNVPIYLDNQQVGNFETLKSVKGHHGYNIAGNQFLDLQFSNGGVLTTTGSSKYNIRLEKGKEYFIKILLGRHNTSSFQIVSKYDFY